MGNTEMSSSPIRSHCPVPFMTAPRYSQGSVSPTFFPRSGGVGKGVRPGCIHSRHVYMHTINPITLSPQREIQLRHQGHQNLSHHVNTVTGLMLVVSILRMHQMARYLKVCITIESLLPLEKHCSVWKYITVWNCSTLGYTFLHSKP